MNSSEKQSSPASTTTYCRRHKVPLVQIEHNAAISLGHTFFYCPMCDAENTAKTKAEEARMRHACETDGIPPHYHAAELGQFDAHLIAPALRWSENPTGFLYVTGGAGRGKTHLACAVKKKLNTTGRRSTLVFSSEMFLALHKSFNRKTDDDEDAVIKKYAPESSKDIAIFDDVGAQKISDYTVDAWFKILDRRYRYNSPTMITTNLTPSELGESLGVRTMSRILSGTVVEFTGEDRRLKEHWANRDN